MRIKITSAAAIFVALWPVSLSAGGLNQAVIEPEVVMPGQTPAVVPAIPEAEVIVEEEVAVETPAPVTAEEIETTAEPSGSTISPTIVITGLLATILTGIVVNGER